MTRKDLQVVGLKIKQGFVVYKKLCALNAEYQCLLGIQVIAGPFNNCCVYRPANACLRMRLHGQKQSKTLENE